MQRMTFSAEIPQKLKDRTPVPDLSTVAWQHVMLGGGGSRLDHWNRLQSLSSIPEGGAHHRHDSFAGQSPQGGEQSLLGAGEKTTCRRMEAQSRVVNGLGGTLTGVGEEQSGLEPEGLPLMTGSDVAVEIPLVGNQRVWEYVGGS